MNRDTNVGNLGRGVIEWWKYRSSVGVMEMFNNVVTFIWACSHVKLQAFHKMHVLYRIQRACTLPNTKSTPLKKSKQKLPEAFNF